MCLSVRGASQSISLSVHVSFYLSIYLSIYLSSRASRRITPLRRALCHARLALLALRISRRDSAWWTCLGGHGICARNRGGGDGVASDYSWLFHALTF